ncbi:MAG: tetratricopeptide repeat protein [Planctomycetota bacterium]
MSATSYTGSEPYVYVSYPREDLRLVQAELDRLEELGIRASFPGEESDADLGRVRGAACVLVLVSDSVSDDAALRRELSTAIQEGKDVWAVHVVDVPLDGAIKLLLGNANELLKHKLADDEYLRRLVRVLPDEVKTRKIELPAEEQPARPAPSRAKPQQEPMAELQAQLAAMGNAPLIALGVLAVIVVVGGFAVLLRGGGARTEQKTEQVVEKTLEPGDEGLSPEELAKRRAERAEEAARRKREREEAEKKREAERAAQEVARDALAKTRAAFEEGNYEEAAKLAGELLAKQPQNAELALLRARSHGRLGKDKEAAADYGVVLAADPKHTDALWGRGEALLRLGDAKGAAADFQAMLALKPKDSFAWIALGDARAALEDWKGAVTAYDEAVKLTPRSPQAYYKRGTARAKAGDPAGAADDQAKARELRQR